MISISLIACAKPEIITQIKVERQYPPEHLLHCKDAPEVPMSGDTVNDSRIFMLDMELAYQDCRKNLRDIRRWAKGEQI